MCCPTTTNCFPHLVSFHLIPQGVLARYRCQTNWLEPTHVLMRRSCTGNKNYPDRGREPLAGVHAYYDILSEAADGVGRYLAKHLLSREMPSHQSDYRLGDLPLDYVRGLQDLTESEQQLFS